MLVLAAIYYNHNLSDAAENCNKQCINDNYVSGEIKAERHKFAIADCHCSMHALNENMFEKMKKKLMAWSHEI